MHWYLDVLRNYATFSGRAQRAEYWTFTLINTFIYVALFILDVVAGTAGEDAAAGLGVISMLYCLAVFLPCLALLIRRLHDTNKSGWWFWLSLIPFVGGLILLIFMVTDSTPGDNDYGPNPKGVTA